MARLRLIGQAGHPNKEFDLKDSTSLGRHPSQDIQVLDRVVSKEHARIVRREGLYYLADLGSRNGTFLNGTRVTRTMELHPGDEIRMGGSSLVFLGEAGQDPTLLGQVTIASEGEETNIQERLAGAGGFSFLPETQIHDEQQLRRDYEKLRIAMELSQDLGIERDLDRLLNRILDRAFSLFAADRAVILLIDEASGQLVPRHVKNRAVQSANEKINISKTVLREVFQEKAGVLSSDAVMDKRFASAHRFSALPICDRLFWQ